MGVCDGSSRVRRRRADVPHGRNGERSFSCTPVRSCRGTARSSSSCRTSRRCGTGGACAPSDGGVPPAHRRRGRRDLRSADGSRRLATAHIVGHSYGALVALQVAMTLPERVGSVALLEPAARGVSSSAQVAAALSPSSPPTGPATRPGPSTGSCAMSAATTTARPWTERSRAPSTRRSPKPTCSSRRRCRGAAVEVRADDAERITQPVLNVQGQLSVQRFVEGSELVQSWFPHAERLLVPGAGHFLMVQNPTAVADGLRSFFSRHPIDFAEQAPAHLLLD